MSDFEQRFGGIGRLYGRVGLERLRRAHVCIIGVGGVGSWVVEALARTGIGALTMIDLDDVCVTNVNRQLPALDGTVGRPKVAVLEERLRLIHPECRIEPIAEFLTAENVGRLLAPDFSWIVDCVDRMPIKALIISHCVRSQKRVLTVGGAGGRRLATRVRIDDLNRTEGDRLLRQVRKKLRQEHICSSDRKKKCGVPCVFSDEPQVFPWADGQCRPNPEPGENLKMDCASGYGAATFVTGAFGFAAAGEVVRRIVEAPP